MKPITFIKIIFLLICSLSAEIILNINFNNHIQGLYTQEKLDEDWSDPSWDQGIEEERVTVVSSPSFNEKSLQVLYPELGVGPAMGGAQWQATFKGFEELYASYYIMFPTGWDGVKGGKLPGLCGAECPTGGDSVTGYNGFSARYMFRPGMKLAIYCYHMDLSGEYGEDFELDFTFERNKWYKLTQRIKLNTPDRKDGEIQAWVDNQQVLSIDTLRFRAIDTIKIDKFYFSTFYGGSTPDWAPLKDEYIYYDEFKIFDDANVMIKPARSTSSANNTFTINQMRTGEVLFYIPPSHNVSLQIVNLRGMIVATPELYCRDIYFCPRAVLRDGVYILQVKTPKKTDRKRFVVVR